MYLLFYTQPDDLVVTALAGLSQIAGERLVLCNIETFLEEVEVDDEIIDGKAKIKWTLGDGTVVSSSDNVKIINRCGFLHKELFNDFEKSDQDYVASETHAYLSFAFNNFRKCLNRPSAEGNGIKDQAKIIQWTRVKRLFTEVECPNYFLGPYSLAPFDLSDFVVHPCDGSVTDQNSSDPKWLGLVPTNKDTIVFAQESVEGESIAVNKIGSTLFWGWGTIPEDSDLPDCRAKLFSDTSAILDSLGIDIGSINWTVCDSGRLVFQFASSWLSYSDDAREAIKSGIETFFNKESCN